MAQWEKIVDLDFAVAALSRRLRTQMVQWTFVVKFLVINYTITSILPSK